jgi:hypothetical protein
MRWNYSIYQSYDHHREASCYFDYGSCHHGSDGIEHPEADHHEADVADAITARDESLKIEEESIRRRTMHRYVCMIGQSINSLN